MDEISSCLSRYGIKKIHTIAFDNKIVSFYTDKKNIIKNQLIFFLKKEYSRIHDASFFVSY